MTTAERLHAYMEAERPNLIGVLDWCLVHDPAGKVTRHGSNCLEFNFSDGSYLEWTYTGRRH